MDNLITLIKDINTDCNLSKKIRKNQFTENKRERSYNYYNLIFCILDNYDPILSNTINKNKKLIFKQRVMEICSQIEENPEKYYNKMKYNSRTMNIKKLQKNIQISSQENQCYFSVINYLNDLYNKHFVLVDKNKMKYYETSDKNYEKVYIMNSNKMYQICDSLNISISKGDNYDCFFLIMDIKTVYTSYLMPMNKYKLNDLHKEAYKIDIHTKDNGKQKLKKTLYDEINLYYLNNKFD